MRRTVRFLIVASILIVVAVAAHAHPNGPITDPIPRIIALL